MGQLVQRPAWPWGALNERKDLGAQAGFCRRQEPQKDEGRG